ncbi:hypothetical protein CHARACLAT_013715 [Characodon lateralis]|uniref:Uncharacterized protein n=1 Tax=Characodon lateralis TaxID=208331 RepID=A0ABU7D6H4_9TELE|nr:hypothetical protein [Characodon lateralis]
MSSVRHCLGIKVSGNLIIIVAHLLRVTGNNALQIKQILVAEFILTAARFSPAAGEDSFKQVYKTTLDAATVPVVLSAFHQDAPLSQTCFHSTFLNKKLCFL